MTHRIRHTHASGRFDRSSFTLYASLLYYVFFSNVVTLTEVVGRDRLHAIMRLDRWAFYKATNSDAAVVWRKRRFAKKASAALHIGRTDNGPRRDIWASIVALQDKKRRGRRVAVSSLHMVADVEGDLYRTLHGSPNHRGADYHSMFRSWLALAAGFAEDHGCTDLILACDSNLNYHRQWVQAYVADLASDHNIRVSWDNHMPPASEGTHGHRLIDLALVERSLRVLSIKILRNRKVKRSSDHLAFTEVLEYR